MRAGALAIVSKGTQGNWTSGVIAAVRRRAALPCRVRTPRRTMVVDVLVLAMADDTRADDAG
jgi:hypothetical protein